MTGCLHFVLLAALSAGAGDATLVEFTDPRCQPCRAMQPVVERLAAEQFPIRQVDVTQQPQLARQYGIVAYPTFVLFAGDREVQRFAGVTTYDDLVQMISRGQAPLGVDARSPTASAAGVPLVRGQGPEATAAAPARSRSTRTSCRPTTPAAERRRSRCPRAWPIRRRERRSTPACRPASAPWAIRTSPSAHRASGSRSRCRPRRRRARARSRSTRSVRASTRA